MNTIVSYYKHLTPTMALNLAAPHTWPAAIMPALAAVCMAGNTTEISVSMSFVLLACVVFMQSSANTFNDYFDYVKGTDTVSDNVDPSDSVLVYNNINPRYALILAIGYLLAAFLLGIFAVVKAGIAPLIIAIVGALFVVAYSAGNTPISYLPLGELASGLVMGGLIPLACYCVLANEFNLLVLVWSIPTIIGVALIMMTNNACDIERDITAGRLTLPIKLGRPRTITLYHALIVIWECAIAIIVTIWFPGGVFVLPFMVLASYPIAKALWLNPLVPEKRLQAMPQILSVNVVLGAFYCAAIAAGAFEIVF